MQNSSGDKCIYRPHWPNLAEKAVCNVAANINLLVVFLTSNKMLVERNYISRSGGENMEPLTGILVGVDLYLQI